MKSACITIMDEQVAACPRQTLDHWLATVKDIEDRLHCALKWSRDEMCCATTYECSGPEADVELFKNACMAVVHMVNP